MSTPHNWTGNVSDSPPAYVYVPSFNARLSLGFSFSFLALCGVSLYGLTLGTLYKNWKALTNKQDARSFYTLVVHLAIADIGLLSMMLVLFAPTCFFAFQIYGGILDEILCSLLGGAGFLAGVILVCCITLQRFFVLVLPASIVKRMFQPPGIHCITGIAWGGGLFWWLSRRLAGCRSFFHPTFFYMAYFCDHKSSIFGPKMASVIFQVSSRALQVIPVCLFLLYLVIYLYLGYKRKTRVTPLPQAAQTQAAIELRILIQGFIITAVLLVDITSFQVIPALVSGWFSALLVGWMMILNSSINSIIYILFNRKLAKLMKGHLGLEKQTTQNTPNIAPSRVGSTR